VLASPVMASSIVPRGVRKAISLLRDDPCRAWTVATLAAACATPRRSLERHFRGYVGSSPSTYLRELRLVKARKALSNPPAGVRVTEIATQCGFTHLGRFAVLYRRRYGESPSATMERVQRLSVDEPSDSPRIFTTLDRPTVGIVPLEVDGRNLSCATCVSDAIAATVCSISWLTIVSPADARYQLRGHIREDCGRFSVTIAMIDALTGGYCWAGHWDGRAKDIGSLENRVSKGIVQALHDALGYGKVAPARLIGGRRGVWDLVMRALPKVHCFDPDVETSVLEWLEQAMELAPNDPVPISMAAWCHGQRASYYLAPQPAMERAVARNLVLQGTLLNSKKRPLAETMFAAACTLSHDLSAASIHADQAVAMDGGSAWAWGRKAWVHTCCGETAAALDSFRVARNISPADSLNFLCSIGIASACFEAGRYDEAIRWYRWGLVERPSAILIHRFLAPSYMLAGRKEEAQHSFAELMRAFPELTIEQVRTSLPHTNRYLDRAAEALESVGMRVS
jgi:AraC-like DNA-binding protein/tetratricopeptide (TPR) repeat protein